MAAMHGRYEDKGGHVRRYGNSKGQEQ